MTLWVSHFPALCGESFASWAARLAVGNGLAWDRFWNVLAKQSGKQMQGSLIPLGIRDQSNKRFEEVVEIFGRGTGREVDTVKAMFAPTRVRIESTSVRSRELLFGTSLQRESSSTKVYTQFCPLCLLEDEISFFRRVWMYSFYSVCEHHNSFLQTKCSGCENPIEVGGDDEYEPHRCPRCNYDLRLSGAVSAPVDRHFCQFQSRIVTGFFAGAIQHSTAISYLLRVVTSSRLQKSMKQHARNALGFDELDCHPSDIAVRFAAMHWIYSKQSY